MVLYASMFFMQASNCSLKENVFAVLVDRHKKVFRKVNIGRLESGPIHGYIFWELAGKFDPNVRYNFIQHCFCDLGGHFEALESVLLIFFLVYASNKYDQTDPKCLPRVPCLG
jgi:hypothetical protein